jgi:hypothetical protein
VTLATFAPQLIPCKCLILNGAEGQNRTADTVIFSHVLYQLSYLGTEERAGANQNITRARGWRQRRAAGWVHDTVVTLQACGRVGEE